MRDKIKIIIEVRNGRVECVTSDEMVQIQMCDYDDLAKGGEIRHCWSENYGMVAYDKALKRAEAAEWAEQEKRS